MAKKKSNSPKTTDEPMLEKIAGKLGHFTGEIIVAKDHLVDMASGAIDTVKETIQNITEQKGAAPKIAAKAAIKKAEKAFVKKVAPAKKAVKKAVKATVKKVEKKTAPAKKAIKKALKKITPAKKASKKAVKADVKKVVKKVVKKAAPAKKAIKKAVKKATSKK